MSIFDFVFYLLAVASVIYFYVQRKHAYWKNLGVDGPNPKFLVGHSPVSFKEVVAISWLMNNFYKTCKNVSGIIGIYFWTKPVAIVTDLDLIKRIMITDFDSFMDRASYINEKDEPVSAHLFSLTGDKWRKLRVKLTPTFTSGKMKGMFPIIVDIAKNFQVTVEKIVEDNPKGFEIKDVMSRFTTDVIGNCAFGLECNSLNDPNNQFRTMGDKAFQRNFWRTVKTNFAVAFPKLGRKLHIGLFGKEVNDFYLNTVKNTVKYREENNVRRNDFMDILIDLKNNAKSEAEKLKIEEIAAQSFIFFLAGFETSSSTIQFCLYELAVNRDIQTKTREHIQDVLKKHNGQVTYECLQEMDYMDKVLSETLRMHSIVPVLTRIAVKDYQVPSTKTVIEKGTIIMVPVYAVQRDPDVYENPDQFDPSRFDKDKVSQRHPCAFMPFGEGPRVCIGLRFGMMQAKIALVFLLTKFHFSPNEKTTVPLELDTTSFLLAPKNGMHLKVAKLNE